MNPIRTEVRGFYPFVHSIGAIDWQSLPSIVAIQGDNGEGKTALLSLDFHALFGRDPNPARGTSADALRFSGAPDGYVETTFSVRGVVYRVRREVSVSPARHQAWLYKVQDDGGTVTCLAGPLVRDTNARIEELIGDGDFALATWFGAQGGAGDLCALPPAGRRAVFAEILRLAEVQKMADKAKELASETNGAASQLEAEVAGSSDPSAELADLDRVAETAEARATAAADAIPEAEAALADARKAVARAEAATLDDLRKDIAAAEHADAEARAAADRVRAAQDRLATAREAARGIASATEAVAELTEARTTMTTLLDRAERFKFFRDWETKRDALAARVASEQARLDDAIKAARVSPEDVSTAADLEALRIAYREAESENKRIATDNAARGATRAEIKARYQALDRELAQLDGEISSAPILPGEPEVCATCPLAAKWNGLPERREQVLAERNGAMAELLAVPNDEPETDLSELRAKGEAARDAKARVSAANEARERAIVCESARDSARHAFAAHVAAPVAEESDPTAEIRANQSRLNALSGAEERLEKAREAATAIPQLEAQFHSAVAESVSAADRDDAAFKRAEAARFAIDLAEDALREHRAKEAAASAAVAKLRHDMLEAAQDRIAALSSIETIRRRVGEIDAKREKAKDLRARFEGLKKLAEAFGPKGVQAILIDRAAPELESILAELLRDIAGGQIQIRISTQSATKGGSVKEDFVIAFSDRDGERDVAAVSGGEQRIARTSVKLALAEWAARLHGTRAEHMRLDEIMDALDPDNANAMVELIRTQADRMGKMIVVTHDPDVAARFPARIVVAGGTVRIEGEE